MSIVGVCVSVFSHRIFVYFYVYLCVYLHVLCVYMRVMWAERIMEINLDTQYTTLFCVFV